MLIVAINAPLTALELAFTADSHSDPGLAAILAIAGAVAIFLLIHYEGRVEAPIFPLRVIASKEARLLTLVSLTVGAVMVILVFYSLLLLQQELGFSPSQAGLLLTPLVATIPVGSIINGRLFPKQTRPQRLMVFGGCLLALGCLMLLAVSHDISVLWILAAFSTNGLALGFLL